MLPDSIFEQSEILDEEGLFLLWGDINQKSSFELTDFIIRHNLCPNDLKCLNILINSPGGIMTDTSAIINMMRFSKIPIYTYGIGWVCSAGTDILMSGIKGHRYIFENTIIMTHSWSAEIDIGGKLRRQAAEKYENLLNKFSSNIILNAGIPKESLDEIFTEYDKYMEPEEAIKIGIADSIVSKFPF